MIKYFKEKYKELSSLSIHIKTLLIMSFSMALVFEVIKLAPPFIFKEIIDLLVSQTGDNIVFQAIILTVGYGITLLVLTSIEVLFRKKIIYKIIDSLIDITTKTFKKLLKLDINYHEKNNTGTTISKVMKGFSKVAELLFSIEERLFPIFAQSIVTLITLFFINWQSALAYMFFVPIFLFTLISHTNTTGKLREEYHKYEDQYSGMIGQSISNIRTVKDFGTEEKEQKKAKKFISKYEIAHHKRTKIGIFNLFIQDTLVNVARMSVLLIAVFMMSQGEITAGSLVLIMTLSEKAFINLSRLARVHYRIQDVEPAVGRIKKIHDEEIKVLEKLDSKLKITLGDIKIENLSFSYNTSKKALSNINLKIKDKSVTALVGRSGSGKSTLVKLLLRHFDPNQGKIIIDKNDIKDYSFKELKNSISIVSQDVELFNESIFENIAYGKEKTSKKEVIKAAKMANAHNFIKEFENGYETVIGERGIRLSGGQKQRIAIARAIIKNPKIIIFDEATSSLDSESEKYIHKSLFNLIGKFTLIIIAHRFSTIEHADNIILLEKGKIKEQGTHKELMGKKGIFKRLRDLQKLGEVTD
jgi:ABC-type multidrug transport system fused ATPase/permease subunit